MGNANGGKPGPKKAIKKAKPITKKAAKKPAKVESKGVPELPKNTTQNDQEQPRVSKSNPLEILKDLSDKHLYWCKRYVLNGGNASKAGRESGFSPFYSAHVLAHNPLVIEEVARFRASISKKFEVTTERIIEELVKVAFSNLGDFMFLHPDGTPIIDCTDIGMDQMAALGEVTQDIYYERPESGDEDDAPSPVKKTKIKMHSKLQALDTLCKILRSYGENGGLDNQTSEDKALKIQTLLRQMAESDGARR